MSLPSDTRSLTTARWTAGLASVFIRTSLTTAALTPTVCAAAGSAVTAMSAAVASRVMRSVMVRIPLAAEVQHEAKLGAETVIIVQPAGGVVIAPRVANRTLDIDRARP